MVNLGTPPMKFDSPATANRKVSICATARRHRRPRTPRPICDVPPFTM